MLKSMPVILAEAALAEGVPYIMSGTCNAMIEELPPAAARNGWYQLYTGYDHAIDEDIVRRAADAGRGLRDGFQVRALAQ